MDFNKLKEMGLEYAEKGKNAAMDLAERGKTQAKIVSEQAKLAKAQRQLGALVYSLAKGNEENQPLVDKLSRSWRPSRRRLAPPRWRSPVIWRKSLLQRMPLPRKKRQQKRPPRRMPPRPAPSAVLRSRTMHCSATSAARSCKYSQNSAGAVSCWGTAPLYVKNVREIGRKSRKMRLNPCKRAKAAVQLKSSF